MGNEVLLREISSEKPFLIDDGNESRVEDDTELLRPKVTRLETEVVFLQARIAQFEATAPFVKATIEEVKAKHRLDSDTTLKSMEEKHNTEIKKLQEGHKAEMTKLAQDHKEKLTRLEKNHEKAIMAFETDIGVQRMEARKIQGKLDRALAILLD